jgi:hypothetical protein
MADAITVISGVLEDAVVDPPSPTAEMEHYHPNVSATLSIQGFVPVASIPNTVIVRARQAVPGVSTRITCRAFDSVGNAVFVSTPTISIDGITDFGNFAFGLTGSSRTTFPALSIYTIELEVLGIDLCGINICYKPSFPMICEGNATSPSCVSTTVIS